LALRLAKGTSLERIAAESVTRGLFGFVHGDMWFMLLSETTTSGNQGAFICLENRLSR
jgi:hypothetical protein